MVQLKTENLALQARVDDLEKQLAEAVAKAADLEKQLLSKGKKEKGASKARLHAEAALKLLREGPVTAEQLRTIDPKYPGDCIYFARSILGFLNSVGQFIQYDKTLGIKHFPAYYASPSRFMTATDANAPRQVQLGLKLIF